MIIDDSRQYVGEVGLRIDAVEFASLDERGDDRPMLAAAVRAGKEGILAIESNGRMVRSTMLESISIRPSSMKRVRPSHRDSA